MTTQTTMIIFCLLLLGCASAGVSGPRADTASAIRTLQTEGTLSVTGTQNMNGIPFTAILAEGDSSRITMSGPFGMTAVRVYTVADSFTVVNYLSQEVTAGRGDSATLKSIAPIAMNLRDLISVVRGRVPGGTARFTTHTSRNDGAVLYGARDKDGGVEFALVDTVRNTLRQYQRKNSAGVMLVDVLFDDFKDVQSIPIAHSIRISVDDKKETLTMRVTTAKVNEPIAEPLAIEVPSAFKRVNYR